MSEKLTAYTPLEVTSTVIPDAPDVPGAYTVNADVKEDEFNFTTIQAAVNAIPVNSVLYITTGVYTEDVTWNKKLSVIGLGGDNFSNISLDDTTPDVLISGEQTIGAAIRFYSIYFKRNTVGQTNIKSGTWPADTIGDASTHFTRCGIHTESVADYSVTNTFDYGSLDITSRTFLFHHCLFASINEGALAITVSKQNRIVGTYTEGNGTITIKNRAIIVFTYGELIGQIDGTALQSGAKGFAFTADTATSTTLSNISDLDNARLAVGDVLIGSGIAKNTKIVTLNNEGADANTVIIDTSTTNTAAAVIIQNSPIIDTPAAVIVTLTDAAPDTLTNISDLDNAILTVGDVVTGTFITPGTTIISLGNEGGNANTASLDSGLVQNAVITVIPTNVHIAVALFGVSTYTTDDSTPFIQLNDDNWVTVHNCEFTKLANAAAIIELNSTGASVTGRLRYGSCRFNGQNVINRNGGAASINSFSLEIDEGV